MGRSVFPPESGEIFPEPDDAPVYGNEEYKPFPLEESIRQMLSLRPGIVLDPSALPSLPQLLELSDMEFHIPLVLYQILAVPKDGVSPASVPDLPQEEVAGRLMALARKVLYRWISPRHGLDWDVLRGAMESPRCHPISAWRDDTLDIQRRSRVAPRDSVEAELVGIGTDLVALTVGQEVAGAAEEELPIVGSNERPIVRLASMFMATLLVKGPNRLIDLKQQCFERFLHGAPRRTRGFRWFAGFVLGVGSFFPAISIPAGVGAVALMVVDP